jgi:hypothetical protein
MLVMRAGFAALMTGTLLAGCGLPNGESARTKIGDASAGAPAIRQAGLWEQKVTAGRDVQVTRMCLDKGAEALLADAGDRLRGDSCTRSELTAMAGGEWRFLTVCRLGGASVATSGTASGDFTKGYEIAAASVTVGAPGARPGAPRKISVQASWRGACPAGLRPGQMIGPGGRRLEIADLARAPAA